MNNTKTLETERLILRKFTMEDVEETFNNWASDKKQQRSQLGKHIRVQRKQKKILVIG